MKVVINKCYGGFSISEEAVQYLVAHNSKFIVKTSQGKYCHDDSDDVCRSDPVLIRAIEELGVGKVNTWVSDLKIVEVPENVHWVICDYDGLEWVAESHRTWD